MGSSSGRFRPRRIKSLPWDENYHIKSQRCVPLSPSRPPRIETTDFDSRERNLDAHGLAQARRAHRSAQILRAPCPRGKDLRARASVTRPGGLRPPVLPIDGRHRAGRRSRVAIGCASPAACRYDLQECRPAAHHNRPSRSQTASDLGASCRIRFLISRAVLNCSSTPVCR